MSYRLSALLCVLLVCSGLNAQVRPVVQVNGQLSCAVNFDGEGGAHTVNVRSSTGWWYLSYEIPWCEVTDITDSTFVLRCNVNSGVLSRHSYIKVLTEGAGDATVAVVQASLPDNFLSSGSWGDSLGCNFFEFDPYSLLISGKNGEIENCPQCSFYVGQFEHGKKSGKGYCYDRYGNLIYSGMFKKDVPAGEYPSRDSYSKYKFECQKFSNGTVYIGETVCGVRHGYGVFVSKDGAVWYGRWNNGRQGEGSEFTSEASDSYR